MHSNRRVRAAARCRILSLTATESGSERLADGFCRVGRQNGRAARGRSALVFALVVALFFAPLRLRARALRFGRTLPRRALGSGSQPIAPPSSPPRRDRRRRGAASAPGSPRRDRGTFALPRGERAARSPLERGGRVDRLGAADPPDAPRSRRSPAPRPRRPRAPRDRAGAATTAPSPTLPKPPPRASVAAPAPRSAPA